MARPGRTFLHSATRGASVARDGLPAGAGARGCFGGDPWTRGYITRGGHSCSVTDVHDAAGGGPKRGVSGKPGEQGDTLDTVGPLRRTQKVV